MKRTGNLYNKIATIENIKIAYYKAKKGKRFKKDVLLFNQNLEKNLNDLHSDLLQKNPSIGDYHFFKIYDPKERTICAACFRERILHHAVMNILDPVFERFQIYDSYACRKGKGTHKALERALYYTKRYCYFAKLDIKKYFDSINHSALKELLRKKIKDKEVLSLFDRIIDSYQTGPGRGIPIGNLTSQYFANYVLGFADRYSKECLHLEGYIRYMDDMVLWDNNKERLRENTQKIIEFIQSNLLLNVKQPYLNRCASGVPFLGFLVKPNGLFLSNKSKKRFVRRLKGYLHNYNHNKWNIKDLSSHVTAIIGWTLIAKSRGFRYNVFNRYCPRDLTA